MNVIISEHQSKQKTSFFNKPLSPYSFHSPDIAMQQISHLDDILMLCFAYLYNRTDSIPSLKPPLPPHTTPLTLLASRLGVGLGLVSPFFSFLLFPFLFLLLVLSFLVFLVFLSYPILSYPSQSTHTNSPLDLFFLFLFSSLLSTRYFQSPPRGSFCEVLTGGLFVVLVDCCCVEGGREGGEGGREGWG